ncbi:Zinc finger transcription factor YY1 [Camellia lanceoleosa]|uniref:Zinc finger transcription factor YY1 n=1 Tax=Camellia lanceoleosa TaxID=1840588 RepID=A0ACC0HMD9_9ERIC|nr:Zinc finger transcription factor YY1 [Camellia lanceoleosa]
MEVLVLMLVLLELVLTVSDHTVGGHIEGHEREVKQEPTTEVLFLCSYEGCGKTFIDAGALRKHSHIHGERQYVCHYEGCGKVATSRLLLIVMSY